MHLAAIGPFEALFHLAGLDDRLSRWRGNFDRLGHAFRRLLPGKLVHQALPGFFRQLVEKLQTLRRIHLLDDRVHLACRPRMQEDVGVVVRQNRREPGGEIDWEPAEQLLLFFKRNAHQQARGIGGVERAQHRQSLLPALLGNQGTQLFG